MSAEARRQTGHLSDELRGRFLSPRLWLAVLVRPGLATGIVFIMTVKPPAVAAGVAVAAGSLIRLAATRRNRTPDPAADAP